MPPAATGHGTLARGVSLKYSESRTPAEGQTPRRVADYNQQYRYCISYPWLVPAPPAIPRAPPLPVIAGEPIYIIPLAQGRTRNGNRAQVVPLLVLFDTARPLRPPPSQAPSSSHHPAQNPDVSPSREQPTAPDPFSISFGHAPPSTALLGLLGVSRAAVPSSPLRAPHPPKPRIAAPRAV
ncbi:hypothetical protein B0H17DRAFT_1203320 [Mycena rosella]|uniref:Uncharacterized protein n=1 Tax=Mycena rosella TaxID=1033263 RepID=A0AAD7DBS8_MYCRO|nr:hypothetical protein B0H17DRAFT_1203320 [Mycena rosella]